MYILIRDHVLKQNITNRHMLSSLPDSLVNSSQEYSQEGVNFGEFLRIRPHKDDLISILCCLDWLALGGVICANGVRAMNWT